MSAILTFDDIRDMIRNGENFSFSRFGDGEWAAILGVDGKNCDGHKYYADMGEELGDILRRRQTYRIAMQPKAMRDMAQLIAGWCVGARCKIVWDDADVLHNASQEGKLLALCDDLKGRDVILVGPPHHKGLKDKYFRVKHHVVVPDEDVWPKFDEIFYEIDGCVKENDVVLISMSMPSCILIDKLARKYCDTITCIDCGSVWEPYLGRCNRKYHYKIMEEKRK